MPWMMLISVSSALMTSESSSVRVESTRGSTAFGSCAMRVRFPSPESETLHPGEVVGRGRRVVDQDAVERRRARDLETVHLDRPAEVETAEVHVVHAAGKREVQIRFRASVRCDLDGGARLDDRRQDQEVGGGELALAAIEGHGL